MPALITGTGLESLPPWRWVNEYTRSRAENPRTHALRGTQLAPDCRCEGATPRTWHREEWKTHKGNKEKKNCASEGQRNILGRRPRQLTRGTADVNKLRDGTETLFLRYLGPWRPFGYHSWPIYEVKTFVLACGGHKAPRRGKTRPMKRKGRNTTNLQQRRHDMLLDSIVFSL